MTGKPSASNVRVRKIIHKTKEVTESIDVTAIKLDTLEAETRFPCSLYIREKSGVLKKILDKDGIYTIGLQSALLKLENPEVLVDREEMNDYLNYITAIRQEKLKARKQQLTKQSRNIYTSASDTLEKLFQKPDCPDLMSEARTILTGAVDFVKSDQFSVNTLIDVSSKDYSTHTHCMDTAIVSLGFANHLKFNNNDLNNIGLSALLHDIGKSRVDQAIINKDGTLTEEEFELVKKHPLFGFFILKAHKETNRDILNGIRSHHEKYDGSGYPDKLQGKEIPLFAQIISMADIFTAITTNKTYRDACSSFDTINIMKNTMSFAFDGNLFMEFIKFMGPKN